MIGYLISWGHLYVVHFGVWMTFTFAATIYKKGLPDLKNLPALLKTAVVISAILSIFSSHSHHYMTNVIPDTKISHENKDK
jgi:cell division protein FtsL